MHRRVWYFLLLFALCAPRAGLADETAAGIALTATHGTHRESGGTATAPLEPVPVLTLSHRSGCFQAAAEGLPPLGAVSVASNALGMQNIQLTYADAALRYWNRAQTLAVGVGASLYNQRTQFLAAQTPTQREILIDRSRVAGTRYEVIARVPLNPRDFFEASVAANPAMHGRFTQTVEFFHNNGTRSFAGVPNWERASQVDAGARFVHRFGEYALSYGVRYVNYAAAFADGWKPSFADANTFLMPYVALQRYWPSGPRERDDCVPPARLPQAQLFLGGELFTAVHADRNGAVRGAVIAALPSFALRVHRGRYDVVLEEVPPVGPVRGTARFDARVPYEVKAGYTNATVRYWHGGSRVGLGFGIGEALYVSQRRVYGQDHIAVRAAGTRFELADAIPVSGKEIVLALGAAPSMHQRSTFWNDGFTSISPPDYGTGSLVDASAVLEVPRGGGHSWLYGLRYFNYTGGNHRRYDISAERTGALGVFAAWGFTLTR